MIGEPGVDEGGNGGGGGPALGGGGQMILQLAQARIETVGDGGLEQAAKALDGVEFRAVGRQGQQPDVFRPADVLARQRGLTIVLSDLLTADSEHWSNLVSTMRSMAQRLVGNVISRLQVSSILQSDGKQFGDGPTNAAEAVWDAMPRLSECGGDLRLLLVAPQSAGAWPENWTQPFDAAAGASTSVAGGTDDALVVCCESQRVPLRTEK